MSAAQNNNNKNYLDAAPLPRGGTQKGTTTAVVEMDNMSRGSDVSSGVDGLVLGKGGVGGGAFNSHHNPRPDLEGKELPKPSDIDDMESGKNATRGCLCGCFLLLLVIIGSIIAVFVIPEGNKSYPRDLILDSDTYCTVYVSNFSFNSDATRNYTSVNQTFKEAVATDMASIASATVAGKLSWEQVSVPSEVVGENLTTSCFFATFVGEEAEELVLNNRLKTHTWSELDSKFRLYSTPYIFNGTGNETSYPMDIPNVTFAI